MTRWMRDFRLIPIVLIAVGCLFALKTIGLMTEGGYTLGQRLGGSSTLVVTTIPGAAVAQMRSPAVPLEVPSARPQGPKLSSSRATRPEARIWTYRSWSAHRRKWICTWKCPWRRTRL